MHIEFNNIHQVDPVEALKQNVKRSCSGDSFLRGEYLKKLDEALEDYIQSNEVDVLTINASDTLTSQVVEICNWMIKKIQDKFGYS